MKVQKTLKAEGEHSIYVLGDMAYFLTPKLKPPSRIISCGTPARTFYCKNIMNEFNAKPLEHFKYFDKGIMATIGRSKAIAQSGKISMSILSARLAWLFIHIYFLIGFKTVTVLLQWIWAYLTFNRGARLLNWTADHKRK